MTSAAGADDLAYGGSIAHRRIATRDAFDMASFALFATIAALIVFTFRQYSISNDEGIQQRYGVDLASKIGSEYQSTGCRRHAGEHRMRRLILPTHAPGFRVERREPPLSPDQADCGARSAARFAA